MMAMNRYSVIPITLALFLPHSEERKKADKKPREPSDRSNPKAKEVDPDKKKDPKQPKITKLSLIHI